MSHGEMANGMMDSLKLFFGDDISQIESMCLKTGDSIDTFDDRVKSIVERLDDGHGVIGFCDLTGGTPYNRCLRLANERFEIISGMNLGMLLEVMGLRLSDCDLKEIDIKHIIEMGRDGIRSLNEIVNLIKNKTKE